MSIFQLAVTSVIFNLDRRSNAQNIENTLGYVISVPNLWLHFHEKVRRDMEILLLFKRFYYSILLQFDITYGKTMY